VTIQNQTVLLVLAQHGFQGKTQRDARASEARAYAKMNTSLAYLEHRQSVHNLLLNELVRRRLPHTRGWGHFTQVCTESTSLALLALASPSETPSATVADIKPLLASQRTDGAWPAVAEKIDTNAWATALAANALMHLCAKPATLAASICWLVQRRPLEASWLVRLKFRFSDRQVRFDPTKYGWPWVPNTVSWVLPTSMAMIALERARKRGLVGGLELETRLRLGAEMLLDRACVGGGWNAGNAVVYGVRLRPHIDATAIALAALQLHHQNPIVRDSLTWLLDRVQCPSAYSLAWLILAAAAYRDVRADVIPALTAAGDRLAVLVEDPQSIQDTSTIALAALALGVGSNANPFEVNA
jgi:hypothetical protein